MKIELNLDGKLAERLIACAEKRNVTPEELAMAYVEDWVSVEFAEFNGRASRRSIYRDGPIAFDEIAAKKSAMIDADLARSASRKSN